jgi:hypothetical protein
VTAASAVATLGLRVGGTEGDRDRERGPEEKALAQAHDGILPE